MKKGVSKLLKKINLLEIIENLNLKKATFKKIGVSLGARGGSIFQGGWRGDEPSSHHKLWFSTLRFPFHFHSLPHLVTFIYYVINFRGFLESPFTHLINHKYFV